MEKLNKEMAIELVNDFIKLINTMPVKFTDDQKEMIAKISKWAEELEK